MPLTTNRLNLRASVRQASDCESTSSTARHPDTEVNDFINRGIAALYYLINESRGGRYYVTTKTFPTQVGVQGPYALDGAFYKLLNVGATVNGRLLPLEQVANEAERVTLSDPNLSWWDQPWTDGPPAKYGFANSALYFYPAPQGIYTVTYDFIPAPPQLTDDVTTLDTIERFDDYIIYYAAREIQIKDEEYEAIATLTGRLAEMEARVRASAPNRDIGMPKQVRDTRPHPYLRRSGLRRWP